MNNKSNQRVFAMNFADIYPLYVQKAERKNRTKEEVDQTICWLTGYSQAGLQQQIERGLAGDGLRRRGRAPVLARGARLLRPRGTLERREGVAEGAIGH